jgi:hypothetical protein
VKKKLSHNKFIAMCCAYNKEHGNVVPPVSVGSIVRKQVRNGKTSRSPA